MNMISTGAFQTEMAASDKQDSLVKKLVNAWEKKNAKVARAGGLSLMALSLAACGSDDDTTATSTTATTTTTTTTTTAESSLKLTALSDDLSGAGDFDAGMVWSPGGDTRTESLQSEDRVEGTGTADSISIATNGGDMAPVFTGVETINMTLSGATAGTLNLSNSTGVTSVSLSSTDGNIGVTGLASSVAAKVHDVADAATNAFFNVKASALVGTADSMTVTVDGFSGTNLNIGSSAAAGVTGAGIETLSVVASGEASTVASLGSSGATTVNVDADANLTVSAFTATAITTINASESSATTSLNVGANINANVFSYTGGAGADTVIATTGFAGTDSMAGGDGADTFSIRPAASAADITVGALNASSAAVFSGFETLDMRSATGDGTAATDFTVDMDHVPGVTAINMRTADTDLKAVFTLNDLSAAQSGAITMLHTGTDDATDSEIVLDLKTDTTDDTATITATTSAATQVVEVNDANNTFENLALTVNGDMNNNVDLDSTSFLTSIDIDGGGATRTMAVYGGTVNTGLSSASIDLSGVASNTTLTLTGAEQTFKGGSGQDTLTVAATLSASDVLDGGAGVIDTLSMTQASVTTINALTAAQATALAANITGFERITISDQVSSAVNMADFGASSNRLSLPLSITGSQTISNLNNGSTVVVSATGNAATDIMTLSTAGAATGTSDSITLIYDNTAADDYGVVALSGYETITVNASESTASANLRIATIDMTVTQSGGAQTTVNFTGTDSVTLGTALDADFISATGIGGALVMGAASTAGSQTITGGAGADTLRGSSLGDTISGGLGVDIILGGGGNDVINGDGGADEINPDAGINIVTTGGGSDDVHLTTAANSGIAAQLTTITDFNAGTSTTGVDAVEFDLSELNIANGDLSAAVADMRDGAGNALASTDNMSVQRITGDGQTGLAATEIFLLQTGATFQDDAALLTAFAAGQLTFSTATVTNNDGVLVGYTTTAGHVNIGIGQFNLTSGSSDSIDTFQTLVTLESVDIANLDNSDFLIVA